MLGNISNTRQSLRVVYKRGVSKRRQFKISPFLGVEGCLLDGGIKKKWALITYNPIYNHPSADVQIKRFKKIRLFFKTL